MREATGTKKRKVQQRGVCESSDPVAFLSLLLLIHSHTHNVTSNSTTETAQSRQLCRE